MNFSNLHYFISALNFLCLISFFIFIRISKIKQKIDWFSPLIIFPSLYLLYLSIGFAIPIKWFGGEILINQWFYYFIGLIFFIIGISFPIIILKSKGKRPIIFFTYEIPKTIKNILKIKKLNNLAFIIFIIGSYFMISVILTRGLPFFSNVQVRRFGEAYRVSGYFFLLGLLVQISIIMLIFSGHLKRRFNVWIIMIIILGTALISLYGSRAQIAPIFMAFVLSSHYLRKKFTFRKIILFSVIGLLLFSSFAFLRIEWSIDYYKKYLEERNYPSELWFFGPGYLTIRAPIDSFTIILNKMPKEIDFWHGRMLISPLTTLLPGKQYLGQYIVTDKIIGGDSTKSGPTAPTALSFIVPFYIDFGIIGVMIGMFFAGALLQWLYLRMVYKSQEIDYLNYFIVLTSYCIWIYGGYFPTLIIIWQLIIINLTIFFIRLRWNYR